MQACRTPHGEMNKTEEILFILHHLVNFV